MSTDHASSQADRRPELEAFGALLVGGWVGQGRWADGRALNVRHEYEWGLERRLVRGRTYSTREGAEERLLFETFFAWHPEEQRIEFTAVSSWGRMDRGWIDLPHPDQVRFRYRPLAEEPGTSYEQHLVAVTSDRIDWAATRMSCIRPENIPTLVAQARWCRRGTTDA